MCGTAQSGRPGVGLCRNNGAEKQGPSIAQSQAMRVGAYGSSSIPLTRERFLECAVGQCPEIEIQNRVKKHKVSLRHGQQCEHISRKLLGICTTSSGC